MIRTRQTPEQIAEVLATARHNEFDAFGKHWQGDIFYSDIYTATKKLPAGVYSQVAQLLRNKNYYVHS